jgi:hypothetical protein
MKVDLLQGADPRWIQWISNEPGATIYHHPLWSGLLSRCYGYSASIFTLIDDTGDVLAGLPLMQINSRLTGRRAFDLMFSARFQPLEVDG